MIREQPLDATRHRHRSTLARRAVAVGVALVGYLLCLDSPALALSVVAPPAFSAWGGCAQSMRFVATGASGPVSWRVDSPYGDLSIDANGVTSGSFYGFDRVSTITATATDASGATAKGSTVVTLQDWLYPLPPMAVGMRCDPAVYRTYWAYDTGATDTFSVVEAVYQPSTDTNVATTFTYSEKVPIWVKQPHYVSNTLVTVMSIPKSIWTNVSFGDYDTGSNGRGPAGLAPPTGSPWSYADPWRGITSSYESVYPYPSPGRVSSDGGHTNNELDPIINLWPKGVEYDVCCGTSDLIAINMIINQYDQGFVWPYCVNANDSIYIGPRFYCIDRDYAAHCFNASMTDCGGYNGTDDVSPSVAPRKTFNVHDAWVPSTFAESGSTPGRWTVGRVWAAPDAGQMSGIKALFASQGIDLGAYPSVPTRVAHCIGPDCSDDNKQLLWEFDGRNTFFCDHVAWQTSRLIASAPYLLNGVYCADTDTAGRYPPPATAVGEGGGAGTVTTPGTGTGTGSGCRVDPNAAL